MDRLNWLYKIAAVLLVTSMVTMTLSGCHTTRGVGRDVQAVGEGVERVGEP